MASVNTNKDKTLYSYSCYAAQSGYPLFIINSYTPVSGKIVHVM